jgi:hypothetical protein
MHPYKDYIMIEDIMDCVSAEEEKAVQTFEASLCVKGYGVFTNNSALKRYLHGKCWNAYDGGFRWIGAGRTYVDPTGGQVFIIMRNGDKQWLEYGTHLRVCVW